MLAWIGAYSSGSFSVIPEWFNYREELLPSIYLDKQRPGKKWINFQNNSKNTIHFAISELCLSYYIGNK